MRASREEQVGGAGESEVMAAFQRIGWAAVQNARHDLGTDLLVLARDARLVDLGLALGVQVKTGRAYFDEPQRDEAGEVRGWWFRDRDRRHIDYWLSHGLPHLLVLHDLETHSSYWQHITPEAVVSTGKGAKVLVSAANLIDDQHLEPLLAVAATLRRGVAWEGSAWTGLTSLAPRDVLRHALIVPRLVAPHPNAGVSGALSAAQAVAMLMQARTRELRHAADTRPEIPSIDGALSLSEWQWRFFGAIGRWVTADEIGDLLCVVDDAPSSNDRAASTVAAASALVVQARADEAAALIERGLTDPDMSPVDHAWLRLQHARACVEIGRLEDARQAAVAVQSVRSLADDVTATAIAGVAALLLFNTSAIGERDVADAITGADTAAAWWRAQTLAWALGALAERTFKSWAGDQTTYIGPDDAHDQLFAASLTAGHVGDHGGWRHAWSLLGRDGLLRVRRAADPGEARDCIDALRMAGDEDGVKLAITRIASDGPAEAITLACASVDLDSSTRTTGPTDLLLMERGGDLLDTATAERVCGWLFAALDDPSSFEVRTSPYYSVQLRLLETLAGVVPAAPLACQLIAIERLLAVPSEQHDVLASAWAQLTRAVPDAAWTAESSRRAGERADSHHVRLRLPLLRVAAAHHQAWEDQLADEVRQGSMLALSSVRDVSRLPEDAAGGLIPILADSVRRQLADAQAGAFGMGSDVGGALALLNAWHPIVAEWEPLFDLLDSNVAPVDYKRGALRTLASLAPQLPDETKTRLSGIAALLADRPRALQMSLYGEPVGLPEAAGLVGALDIADATEVTTHLLQLLDGFSSDRQTAALMAGRRGSTADVGLLAGLTGDPNPDVRGVAAGALASLVATDRTDEPTAVMALERSVGDAGRTVPANVAVSLADVAEPSTVGLEALERLRTHRSAYVRSVATGALAR